VGLAVSFKKTGIVAAAEKEITTNRRPDFQLTNYVLALLLDNLAPNETRGTFFNATAPCELFEQLPQPVPLPQEPPPAAPEPIADPVAEKWPLHRRAK